MKRSVCAQPDAAARAWMWNWYGSSRTNSTSMTQIGASFGFVGLAGEDLERADELTAQRVAERRQEVALNLIACLARSTEAFLAG